MRDSHLAKIRYSHNKVIEVRVCALMNYIYCKPSFMYIASNNTDFYDCSMGWLEYEIKLWKTYVALHLSSSNLKRVTSKEGKVENFGSQKLRDEGVKRRGNQCSVEKTAQFDIKCLKANIIFLYQIHNA